MRNRSGMFSKMADQRGVAMITVLLVGAGLTVVTSAAAFTTIREFQSSTADRRSSEALSLAESGIDQFISSIRAGRLPTGAPLTFLTMNRAGCTIGGTSFPPLALPQGRVGNGTYDATLTVYNPDQPNPTLRFPQDPDANGDPCRWDYDNLPSGVAGGGPLPLGRPGSPNLFNAYFQITSTGTIDRGRRVVRQIIRVDPPDLPVGVFANTLDAHGSTTLITISAFAEADFIGRNQIDFSGLDPYYTVGDIFPAGAVGRASTEYIPAAPHAAGTLFDGGSPEFAGGRPNCDANKTDSGPNKLTQSVWDSDQSDYSGSLSTGCPVQTNPNVGTGYPVTNKFTSSDLSRFARYPTEDEIQALKTAAQGQGIYCSYPGQGGSGSTQCTRNGVSTGAAFGPVPPPGTAHSTIAFVEYRSGTPSQNSFELGDMGSTPSLSNVWPCSEDPAVAHQSIILYVRNGGINKGGGGVNQYNGAFIFEGNFTQANGTVRILGTVISKNRIEPNGNFQFQLDPCWVNNLNGPFLKVVPTQWMEVDR